MNFPPLVMTIAGSDSSGGAGIQADLQTLHSYGVHGVSVITAITAQNTYGVHAIHPVPQEYIKLQMETAFSDFPVAAVKIGMLVDSATVNLVAELLGKYNVKNVVLDPVISATLGGDLLSHGAIQTLLDDLFPCVRVLTPNLLETERLLNRTLKTKKDIDDAAHALLRQGVECVVIKGGHGRGDEVTDHYYDSYQADVFTHRRLAIEAHGTGCAFAAATAAGLALGWDSPKAVNQASTYVHRALSRAFRPGRENIYFLNHFDHRI